MAKLSKKQRCESRYRVKNKKSFEKVLTKQKRFDIIIKSSHWNGRNAWKKVLKKSEKSVDKPKTMWYNKKADLRVSEQDLEN